MGIGDYILLVLIGAALGLAVAHMIKKKKSGGGCCGNCSACSCCNCLGAAHDERPSEASDSRKEKDKIV